MIDSEDFDPKNKDNIKNAIEYFNFWYLIECEHCKTLFLVENSVDRQFAGKRSENLTVNVFCPRCGKENKKPNATGRLKLRFSRKARNNEFDPCTTAMAKQLMFTREVEEKVGMMRDTYRLEKNNKQEKKKRGVGDKHE